MTEAGAVPTVAVVGASGFVGTRLTQRLAARDTPVVAISRSGVESASPFVRDVRIDLVTTDIAPLRLALQPCSTVYYLVHALGRKDLEDADTRAAANLVAALDGLEARVVYLGALGRGVPSRHVRARHAVGETLRASTDAVELRASMIIGRGSASFDILVDVVRRWRVVSSRTTRRTCQPIAIDDVLEYLELAAHAPLGCYEIGGAEVVTYRELVERCATVLGRTVHFLPFPSGIHPVSATLLAAALHIPRGLALDLLDSLELDMVVDPARAALDLGHEPTTITAAIESALRAGDQDLSATTIT